MAVSETDRATSSLPPKENRHEDGAATDLAHRAEHQYAVRLSAGLPGGLLDLDEDLRGIEGCTEDSDEWYAVVRLGVAHIEDEEGAFGVETAYLVDVRRADWPLPEGVTDARNV